MLPGNGKPACGDHAGTRPLTALARDGRGDAPRRVGRQAVAHPRLELLGIGGAPRGDQRADARRPAGLMVQNSSKSANVRVHCDRPRFERSDSPVPVHSCRRASIREALLLGGTFGGSIPHLGAARPRIASPG